MGREGGGGADGGDRKFCIMVNSINTGRAAWRLHLVALGKEKKEMTQRQQEILLLAGMYAEGLRWLARDEYFGKYRNDLCGYREKPHKEGDAHNGERVIYWAEPRSLDSFVTNFDGLADHLFSEIKGTDAEPTSIGELLAEKILEELGGIDAGGKQIQNFFQRQGFL